jgi:hypothetical protein
VNYDNLDIHQKINLKATLQLWAKYAVQHFQEEQDKKIYGLRANKKGVQRSSLGAGYRFGSGKSRTNALRRTWFQNVNAGGGQDRVTLKFLLYGRFLDMGVGRGASHTDKIVARQLKHGRTGRTRKPWYSKRKAYEIKRLSEILAQRSLHVPLDLIENALNIAVKINL